MLNPLQNTAHEDTVGVSVYKKQRALLTSLPENLSV